MAHTPHDLSDEFPDRIHVLHDLRMKDATVARLVDEYNQINETLYRVDTNKLPMADVEALRLRKSRVALRSEIDRMLG
ncbi:MULTISPECIES: YdcH family protein [unclassified Meridianimarinicoccus]|uniref:YdcH family protein n=1 Tax=unclassified Meridianimarinicoccus TaxID=2923344 RepID=UPI001867495B|nr:DUF465 domain-containing protein [Fluviibacterium sp. MJW13]